jgi:hypothetical protein
LPNSCRSRRFMSFSGPLRREFVLRNCGELMRWSGDREVEL